MKFGGYFNRLFGNRKPDVDGIGPIFITPNEETKYDIDGQIVSVPSKTGQFFPTSKAVIPSNNKSGPEYDVQGASIARFFGSTFNPYSYSTFRDLYKFSEPSFYNDYEETYKQNPFTHMVTHYLLNEIMANGYHFEGPGAKVVEDFFNLDGTREKLNMVLLDAIKKGNGFLDITAKRSKLARTTPILPDNIQIMIDEKTGERTYKQGSVNLNSKFLLHMMVKEETGNPYGISAYRANLLFLTALMDVGGDIMSALKRIAYSPIVANLDLDNITDQDEKKRIMAEWREWLKNTESATQNFAIDKKHSLTLLGQGGGAGARLLPTNDLIEPILSVVLINFGVPLGMFLQTGANKSIIAEQRSAMQRFYEEQRKRFRGYIELKLIPFITTRKTTLVFNKPPLSDDTVQKAFELHLEAVKTGVISSEWVRDQWDIDDTNAPKQIIPQTEKPKSTRETTDEEV